MLSIQRIVWIRYIFLMVASLALLVATLACALPGQNKQAAPTATAIPVTTQSVQDLENAVQAAIQTAQSGGSIEVVFTDAQLTSAIALQLQAQPEIQQQAQISNVQVHLQNGQIQVSGDLTRSGITLTARINLVVEVDAQGVAQAKIVEAALGAIPVPQAILDQVTAQVDQYLTSAIGSQMFVESVVIADGKMVVRARPR